jgi:hypothetical protein
LGDGQSLRPMVLWSKQRECIVGYVAGHPTTFIVGHP